MPTFESGQSAAILINGRDMSRLNRKASLSDSREMLDVTTFQNALSAKEFAYGLASGGGNLDGFSTMDAATNALDMATTLGKNRDMHRFLVGPHGLQLGAEALFWEALSTTYSTDLGLAGVPSASVQFATTKYLIRDGVCHHDLNGAASLGGNEVAQLSFNSTSTAQFLKLSPQSAPAQGFSFRLSDYANDTLLKAALKAAIEAMPIYSGRTVTITGNLTGTATKTGVLRFEFDGAVNVDALSISQGQLDVITLNAATGNKTVYGTVVLTPSGTTAIAAQNAVQAKGGQFVGGICTKTGTDPGASFAFAFPVGATPTPMVQPQVTGKVVKNAPGNGSAYGNASAINAYDGNASTNVFISGALVAPANYVGYVFNTPTVCNALTSLNRVGIASLVGSASGDFSDYVILASLSGGTGSEVPAGGVFTFANATAYKGYAVVTGEGNGATFIELGWMGDGAPANDPEASVTNTPAGAGTSSLASVLQDGGLSAEPIYNLLTASGTDAWIDNGAATSVGMVARSHVISLAAGGTLQVIFEDTDGSGPVGAGVPTLANVAAVATHNHTGAGSLTTNNETATVRRFTRTRYVLSGPSAVFTGALARE